MKPVKAGRLRHRVQFQARSATPDAAGQPSETWTTYYIAWAAIQEFRPQMTYQTDAFISQSSYKMEIRYPGSAVQISAQHRAVDESGEIYVIDAPVNTERRNRQVEILCHVLNEAD